MTDRGVGFARVMPTLRFMGIRSWRAWLGVLHGSWLNSPAGVAGLTLLAYAVFTLARLYLLGGDVSRFVIAGPQFINPRIGASVGLSVAPRGLGYDGQFYYLLALDPFAVRPPLPGAHFDVPAYRAQRILYPLVVWALSLGGRTTLTPVMLVVVNVAAVVAISALGAALARRLGVAPLWGLILAFYPGLVISVAADLGEPLALALALGGIFCAGSKRWVWAALLWSLAALTRETTLVIPLALLIAAALARLTPVGAARVPALRLVARENWRAGALAGLVPLLVTVAWQLVLLARWGQMGALASGTNNLGLPLLGLATALIVWGILQQPVLQATLYAVVAYLVSLGELARRSLARSRGWSGYLALAWGLSAALALLLTVSVWDTYWNFLRGASEFGVLGLLLLLGAESRLRWIAGGATLAAWLIIFAAVVGAPGPAL